MNPVHVAIISKELRLEATQVKAVVTLLKQDATIPFIARYRKEATLGLDEVAITGVRDRIVQLEELDKRREAILKSLEQHGHLTDKLRADVSAAGTLTELEDIYLPYRPKRRTRATIARERGLEPLATLVFEQSGADPNKNAAAYLDPEKGVVSIEDALSGARDIIAEIISEDRNARIQLRQLFGAKGSFKSRVAPAQEAAGIKYKDYYDWEEPIGSIPSHRVLAMRRGEREDILNLSIQPPEKDAIHILENIFVKGEGDDANQVRSAVHDSYKRLLTRSIETEMRLLSKEKADAEAIRVFAENLRQLLLAPPLGPKRVMGIDPGFRTGCKVVCLDSQGKLLHHETIYPHFPGKVEDAAGKLQNMCRKFEIDAIAIGNGTAGRETEVFVRSQNFFTEVQIVLVNESGASIYSASDIARKEFPDVDLTVRGAVSIARRLMDPLSELVKIDPKSIGVGQYQHDVDQPALKQSLDDVVISCVNAVGVDVNRASAELLSYVSGLGPQLARNVVSYRNENGPFHSREELQKVPRLGPKAFQQSAGFLRIHHGSNPLDGSAVHPESYHIVEAMAADLGCTVEDLTTRPAVRKKIDCRNYVTETVGMPTLTDILSELEKPGRDPRDRFEAFTFSNECASINDLKPGMKLPGIVTNVTAFGAFVDVGVHQDGLVHISELSDRFIKNPGDVVKVHQKVLVTVLEVDLNRNRISLSMKRSSDASGRDPQKTIAVAAKVKRKFKPDAPFHNPFQDKLKRKK